MRREVRLVLVGDGPIRRWRVPGSHWWTRLGLKETTISTGSVTRAEILHLLSSCRSVCVLVLDGYSRHRLTLSRSHCQRASCRSPQGRGVHLRGEEWQKWLSPAAGCITCTVCQASRRPVREPGAVAAVFRGVYANRPSVFRGKSKREDSRAFTTCSSPDVADDRPSA